MQSIASLGQELGGNTTYQLKHWNSDDGLPQNSVNAITFSKDGFLWVGTYGGVAKFNGLTFERLTHPKLKYARVTTLLEDSKSNMWFGTENSGLFCLTKNELVHYDSKGELPGNGIVDLFEVDSQIIVMVQGHGPVYVKDGVFRFQEYPEFQNELLDQSIIDRNNHLWMTTSNGVFRIKFFQDVIERIDYDVVTADGRAIAMDNIGNIIHADQSGFYQIDTATMTLGFMSSHEQRLLSRQLILQKNQLWFGANQNGLFSKSQIELSNWGDKIDLPIGEVSCILKGEKGIVWVGFNGGGLMQLTPNPVSNINSNNGLTDEIVLAIHKDYEDNIWIGTNSGSLYKKNAKTGDIEELKKTGRGPEADVWAIASDNLGNVWVGSFGKGISQWNAETKSFSVVESWGAKSTVVLALLYDTLNHRLLAGTDRGGVFQMQNNTWTTLIAEDVNHARITQIVLSPNEDKVFITTQGNGIKVIGENGISHLNESNGLPANSIRDIYIDAQNNIWMGTYGKGIIVKTNEGYFAVNQSHGLFDNLISSINEDQQGYLWMSCNKGVFRARKSDLLDIGNGSLKKVTCQVFNRSHGMGDSETNGGFQPSSIKLNGHTLLYPTMKGIAVFNTESLNQEPLLENVNIQEVKYGDTSLTRLNEYLIPKEFRDIQIYYTAPSFNAPELITYEYKLEGYDENWKSSSSNPFTSYTRLAPGSYVFKVRARNGQGMLSITQDTISIIILPYLYERLSIQVAIVLLLIILIALIFRSRIKAAKKRETHLQNQVAKRTQSLQQEKELTEKALQMIEKQSKELEKVSHARSTFFANVSHELKTPLTLIKGPIAAILENQSQTLDESTIHDLRLVERNSDQLNQLIVQLLDIAQSESGSLGLSIAPLNVADLIQNIINQHQNWTSQKNIRVHWQKLTGQYDGLSDEKMVEKVFTNLFSNAIKFTPKDGVINIKTEVNNNKLQFSITDSGQGIHAKDLPHIFDRFYKSRNDYQANAAGSGVGLAVVQEFVKLLDGSVEASSTIGQGATFKLSIPFTETNNFDASKIGKVALKPSRISLPNSKKSTSAPENKEELPLVLIIEDHEDIRTFIKSSIGHLYNCIEAENGKVGLQMAQENLPDIIVSDIMMPEMDGIEMLKHLRSSLKTDFIPLVLLTAKGSAETRITGWREGADAYLAKPFNAKELISQIKNILSNRQKLKNHLLFSAPKSEEVLEEKRSVFEMQFENIVSQNLTNPEYSFNESLGDLAMSLSKFQRLTKEHYQVTPQVYLRTKRLELAKELVEKNSGNISEIAYSCGFNSISYFNRAFKSHFKHSPSQA